MKPEYREAEGILLHEARLSYVTEGTNLDGLSQGYMEKTGKRLLVRVDGPLQFSLMFTGPDDTWFEITYHGAAIVFWRATRVSSE